MKRVKVAFRVYDPQGDRISSKGPYFGILETKEEEEFDATSPRIQPFGTVAKNKDYMITRSHIDSVNDVNDHVFE